LWVYWWHWFFFVALSTTSGRSIWQKKVITITFTCWKTSSVEIMQNTKNWLVSLADELISVNTPRSFHGHVQREEALNADLPTIPLIWIQHSTNYFSELSKLGEGGFGPVYKVSLNFGLAFKLCTICFDFSWFDLSFLPFIILFQGNLEDGTEVAVKRLSKASGQGLEEFKNEVIFIAKLQHRNLVRLLGCCIEENEKLLVYEYMPNSSLDSHLFSMFWQNLILHFLLSSLFLQFYRLHDS